jgi:2-polyprenyl-6-methoxyphenol hydroxylase-like FAD-dependent oxidoreductase
MSLPRCSLTARAANAARRFRREWFVRSTGKNKWTLPALFSRRSSANSWNRLKSHSRNPSATLLCRKWLLAEVVLVGESAFVLRPHTAAAAAKAAADGMALGEALREGDDNLAENLRRFETPQMQMGIRHGVTGRA